MAKSSKKRNKAPLEPAIESVLTFDGQDDYIELPPASIPSGNAITCSFWAYGGDALPTANSVVCALDANGTRLLNIHLPWSDSVIYFDCGANGGSFDRINKQAQPSDYKGKWSHWAFTKDVTTGEMKIYLNGQLWHSGTGKTFALPKTVNAQLGCYTSGSHYYQGKLAEVQFWNCVRTQAEIQQDMSCRLNGDEPGLVSYLPLNEGSGAIAEERTSNANHGTIHGNPSWEPSTLSLVDAPMTTEVSLAVNFPTDSKIKLKSWKGDYLHRPDSAQGVTTWNTGEGNEWTVEAILSETAKPNADNKIKLKSWKGDYLHRPDSAEGVTTWNTGVGNEWTIEAILSETAKPNANNKIKLKSWKGDYLHRPDSAQGVTTWNTGVGNEWEFEVMSIETASSSPETPTQESNVLTITQVGPAGSAIAATAFSIQPRTGAASRIHRVNLSGGWAVDKIQVQYETPTLTSPEIYDSEAFGGGGGSVSSFALAPEDYLTSISGSWGAQAPGYPREEIISLQFHTHQGNQSQVFGGGNSQKQVEPFTLVALEGSEIIGFFGACGSHQNGLVRLGIYIRPVQAKPTISIIEEPSEPATAPPNVSPSPAAPTAPSDAPVIPAAVSIIEEPSEPAVTLSRQQVLVFDANQQGIAVGGGALRPQGRFTIEAWIYPATEAGKQVILAEGETLFYLEGGELKFQTALNPEAIASTGAGMASGNWYHVAVARGGSRPGATKLYINGIQNDNQIAIPPILSFGNTYLGGQPDVPDSSFQGKLLEVRVWRYARSLADIEANRLYPLTGRELGLVRYWALNEGFGTAIGSKTTNRAVATLTGDFVWEETEIPLKLKLDPQERLTRSTGLEDYGYWFREMAKQQKTEADPPFRRGRIWA